MKYSNSRVPNKVQTYVQLAYSKYTKLVVHTFPPFDSDDHLLKHKYSASKSSQTAISSQDERIFLFSQ